MKNLYTITLVLFSFFLSSTYAQTPTNATVYDCANVSKNIYATLGSGKSIVVLSKGFDCSICINAAPAWQTFAAANTNAVEVWGAMTFTYGMAVPNCNNVSTWRNTHGWNNIFMFIDTTERWYQSGTPRYIVYSARDSSIVYQGRNATTARNIALNNSVVGSVQNYTAVDDVKMLNYGSYLVLTNLPSDLQSIQLVDINGRLISPFNPNSNQVSISAERPAGVYFLRFTSTSNQTATLKVALGY